MSSPCAGAPPLDFVITVCDNAAGEICPIWPGQPMTAHWGIADPAAAEPDRQGRAFRDAYFALQWRIGLLLSLPLESIDAMSLQTKLREIGRTTTRMSPEQPPLSRRVAAEGLGSFFLFACVIGSGIMAQNLAGGNDAIALLGNTLATGAILFVLITMLGPISGAHMNPAVSLVAASRRELRWSDAAPTSRRNSRSAFFGAWAAHLMFDLPTLQLSVKARSGLGQWTGEFIATFGLILTILGTVRHRREWVPATVALYITAAYWFTSSTSFANPAITVARSLSNTFAGISPHDVPLFVIAQLAGAALAALAARWLFTAAH